MLRLSKRKKEGTKPTAKQQAMVLPLHTGNRSLEFLVELIKKIRPDNPRNTAEAELKFKAFLYQVSQERSALFSLRKALLGQFLKTGIVTALTESGIVSGRGFVQELMSKIKHKFLPALQGPDDFLFVINKIFYKKSDHLWVEGIDPALWKQFFEMLGIQINLTEPKLIKQLQQSLQILSYRISALGLEKEMTHRYENIDDAIYPFLEQNRLVNEYLQTAAVNGTPEKQRFLLGNISEALHNCNQSIQWISEQRRQYGTSLAQTYIITRLQQQINRLFIILDVLDADNNFNTDRFAEYFKTVVRNENRKNSLKEFISENTGYLAYQIAEHGGRTGERYITTTRKEFWKMFWSAAGGGIIISFIGIIKNLLSNMKLAPFWQGFLYSSNYSLGFILIQDTGSTLATKQPAYTANNVASSFDVQKVGDKPDLRNLAITVAKVSRTQLASFAGNLLVVFPLTYLLALLYFEAAGTKIASGAAAQKLLTDQQPFHSLALLYACFTGFFLFASGLIAGYVENYLVYGKVGQRLRVSAANTAIGFFGLDNSVPVKEILYTVAGVLSIGFLNFAVSFALAFFVAVKSRGIHLKDYPEFLGILGRYLKKYPKDFIKAPAVRNAEQLS